jgi:PBSX family phage portal protein
VAIKKVQKAEAKAAVVTVFPGTAPAITANALEVEDEFNPFYMTGVNATTGHVLRPPYDPKVLERLTQENNILGSCIDAMVVNIAGTGHKIEKEDATADDADEEQDPVAKKLEDFFKEPYPGISFITMRRDLERDMERTGYGYLEVLRNAADELVFLRNVPARTMRICKLDAPVPVEKTIVRNGKEETVVVQTRERRFVQLMSGKLIFFKEFGASRDLNKNTGIWAKPGEKLDPSIRATEVLYFQVGQDPSSPYGVPRWEGQIPSIIGSRSAEEQNVTYLQSGGLPPALIIVQGGAAAADAKQALQQQFAPGNKGRVAMLEIPSTEGTLDKPGSVKVSVERFGSERNGDAMFENYDAKCAERVLRAFRISAIFIGKTDGFNFATAYASYLAGESQVFAPERRAFDEVITRKILPEIGGKGYLFKSNPIAIKDVDQQVKALALAAGLPGVDPESLIDQLNEVSGLNVQFSQEEIDKMDELAFQQASKPVQFGPDGKPVEPPPKPFGARPNPNKPGAKPVPGEKPGFKPGAPGAAKPPAGGAKPAQKGRPNLKVVKTESVQSIAHLADQAMLAMRLAKMDDLAAVMRQVDEMHENEQRAFRRAVAVRHFLSASADPEGLGDIAGCTAELLKAKG